MNNNQYEPPGKHVSYWIDSSPQSDFPALTDTLQVDVVIIGAGITGLTAGLRLQNSGKQVAILEADSIASGVSGHTTAKITSQHGLIYNYLTNKFSKDTATKYARAQEDALAYISQLVEEHSIACNFTRASSFAYTTEQQSKESLKQEVQAAQAVGLPASFTEKTELPFQIAGAIEFKNQAHFHPRNYLLKLAELFTTAGGVLFEHSRVLQFDESEEITVSTENAAVKAQDCIFATHYPLLTSGAFFSRLTTYRSYVYGLFAETPLEGMYISHEEPLFSVRPQHTDQGTMLIATGLSHTTGHITDTASYYHKLEKLCREHLAVKRFAYYWSTQDTSTLDRLPYIGLAHPFTDHLYVATGFGGWGMTNGTTAGLLLSNLITKGSDPLAKIFDPSRASQLKEVAHFVSKNAHVGSTFLKSRLRNYPKLSDLKLGEAGIFDHDNKKVAAYRDYQGKTHVVSATCTHLGCLVAFNSAEKSWDCPCHGSRFSATGTVLHGPAMKELKSVKE